jgi:signal-transduction protein with cAMP-binding, CBS, and nucleotidyltransferase domain
MSSQKLIRELKMGPLKVAYETDSISHVVKIMKKNKIGAVVIIDQQKNTVGIFTERDLLMRVVDEAVDLKSPISQVMTKNLVCAQLHDRLETLPQLMIDGKFRHVPIVDGFEPVGILSIRDVLSFTYEELKKYGTE